MAFQLSSVPSNLFHRLIEDTCRIDALVKNVKIIRSKMTQVAACPMNGGNGLHSYSKNSFYQRKAIEAAEELINRSIIEEFDIPSFSSLKTFNIADLGCSVGPNTLLSVDNIIKAMEGMFQGAEKASNLPDFRVFFNDQATNDFNQLFLSLPPKMRYFVAGVPGSFYDRLFPSNSLHFVHSSFASQWLSRIPEAALDKSSPSYNKGRVHYSNSTAQVIQAFEDQFSKDLGNFLELRAHEIVPGGLLALTLPGRQNGTPHSKAFINHAFEQLESVIVDMAKEGKINEETVDSFNVSLYFASLEEVESIVRQNGYFSIKIMKNMTHEKPHPNLMSTTLRAITEGNIKDHFGEEISDEIFDSRLPKKFEEAISIAQSCESIALFVSLKRV